MSKARPVLPGAVLFLTRRVHKRQFLLAPSKELNQLFAYVVAVYAQRYRIALHALVVMSNHWHAVLSDLLGTIVDFEREVHGIIARALNTRHRESESLWSSEQSCRVECGEPDDALDKVAYTMANPVAAGLVAHGHRWPGLRYDWTKRTLTVRRPDYFFRGEQDGGAWPEEVTLALTRPPGFDHLDDDELEATISTLVEEREQAARDERRAEGKRFLGRRHIRKQSRHAYPTSPEEGRTGKPRLCARSRWARLELLRRSRAWSDAYASALHDFRAGDRDAVFPYGTWKMVRYYGCRTGPPPG
jgi:putative transposase